MKKILTIFLLFIPFVSIAEMDLDIRNQMLDSEIEKYTKVRDEKYEELKKCEKATTGFKIAGITTLVATGVGVYGNIKLSQKLNGKSGSRGGGAGGVVDGVSGHEQISELEAECRDYSIMGLDDILKVDSSLTREQINEYCAGTGYSV